MIAPRIPSFLKTPKSKIFDYKPRYYDKRKEELEQLKKTGKRTKGLFFKRNNKQIAKGNRTKRLVIIIIGLFLLTYLILTF
ncbi:MAG: hypothetical protein H8E84_03935 [Flavobacteriales bacterium]|nr:hypothetical protein [Flavobacteriales bacterium]